jgi:hypothetical protein
MVINVRQNLIKIVDFAPDQIKDLHDITILASRLITFIGIVIFWIVEPRSHILSLASIRQQMIEHEPRSQDIVRSTVYIKVNVPFLSGSEI